MGLNLVIVKDVQVGLSKIITWTKIIIKGKQGWKRHALKVGCDIKS
jgi:hypothetical protein